METCAILRRRDWRTPADLEEAAGRSTEVGEEMADRIAWIPSYALSEDDGSVGTICIYQAVDADAVRAHAAEAGLPADEVIPVADTIVVRPDPEGSLA
jgi:hypothetical protein